MQKSKFNLSKLIVPIITAIIICCCAIFCSCQNNNSQSASQNENKNYYDAQFHRGGRDARAENTMYSYFHSIEQGATTIEGDVQMTKDGVLVMSHNPVLNPDITKDKNGNYITKDIDIRTSTYDELKQYNVGYINPSTEYYAKHGTTQVTCDAKIPRLEDLLQLIQISGNKTIKISIETKLFPDPDTGKYHKNNVDAKEMTNKINELIKKYDMEDRTILQSFDWSSLVEMKNINPKIKTSALYSEEPAEDTGRGTLWKSVQQASPWLAGANIHYFNDDVVECAHSFGFDILSPQYNEITKAEIDKAHSFGMLVIP